MIGLKDILSHKKSGTQIWLTLFGLLVGFTASVLAVVLIWDIQNERNSETDAFGNNTIVVQKAVSSFTSLGMNNTSFSKKDIAKIESKDFVVEVASFKSANYEVGISENPGDGIPGFYAEMFLQSVPNSFIADIDSSVWHWESEADVVPIILPRDFLTLVNYGIAPSKGMPQISEELIKSVRVQLHLIGRNDRGKVLGRVVGFSSKIASVLVPESFIDYSNAKYASKTAVEPNRLFIKTKAKSFSQLNQLISDMNLDVSESEISIAKITTYFLQMVLLFFVFAFIILALSILALLQYLQLTLIQFQYEVGLLIKLGYQPSSILKIVRNQFLKILFGLALLALGLVFIFKISVVQPFLSSVGIQSGYSGFIFGILFVILLLVIGMTVLKKSVLNTILKIYKKV